MLFMILLWRIFMGPIFRGCDHSNRRSTHRMLWHWQAVGSSDTVSLYNVRLTTISPFGNVWAILLVSKQAAPNFFFFGFRGIQQFINEDYEKRITYAFLPQALEPFPPCILRPCLSHWIHCYSSNAILSLVPSI
jgi:hypothetical protein